MAEIDKLLALALNQDWTGLILQSGQPLLAMRGEKTAQGSPVAPERMALIVREAIRTPDRVRLHRGGKITGMLCASDESRASTCGDGDVYFGFELLARVVPGAAVGAPNSFAYRMVLKRGAAAELAPLWQLHPRDMRGASSKVPVLSLSLSPDGQMLAVADGDARLIHLAQGGASQGTDVRRLGEGSMVQFSPDGLSLAIAHNKRNSTDLTQPLGYFWNFRLLSVGWSEFQHRSGAGQVEHIAFSSQQPTLAVVAVGGCQDAGFETQTLGAYQQAIGREKQAEGWKTVGMIGAVAVGLACGQLLTGIEVAAGLAGVAGNAGGIGGGGEPHFERVGGLMLVQGRESIPLHLWSSSEIEDLDVSTTDTSINTGQQAMLRTVTAFYHGDTLFSLDNRGRLHSTRVSPQRLQDCLKAIRKQRAVVLAFLLRSIGREDLPKEQKAAAKQAIEKQWQNTEGTPSELKVTEAAAENALGGREMWIEPWMDEALTGSEKSLDIEVDGAFLMMPLHDGGVVLAGPQKLECRDLLSGETRWNSTARAKHLAPLAGGSVLALSNGSAQVSFVDAVTGQECRPPLEAPSPVTCLASCAGGRALAAGCAGGHVQLWELW